jgi:hypothetical protein
VEAPGRRAEGVLDEGESGRRCTRPRAALIEGPLAAIRRPVSFVARAVNLGSETVRVIPAPAALAQSG